MNEISERFFRVIEGMDTTIYKLAKEVPQITSQKISNVKNNKSEISIGIVSALCEKYPNINADYILTGRGTPLKGENEAVPDSSGHATTTEEELAEAKRKGLKMLPEINFQFAAGQTELINPNEIVTRYWYLPDCKDCECVVQVVGNSMQPTLPSGCYVALKRYYFHMDNPNTIPFGNVFGIVVEDKDTGDYHGHIKILRRYKDQSLASKYWIAHSINDAEFDDFDIEIAQVRSLWVVKQHIVNDML